MSEGQTGCPTADSESRSRAVDSDRGVSSGNFLERDVAAGLSNARPTMAGPSFTDEDVSEDNPTPLRRRIALVCEWNHRRMVKRNNENSTLRGIGPT